jgi:hypothetical protein
VSTTVSGLRDMDSMPSFISHCAKSRWSDGPCPQMPMYFFFARQVEMARESRNFTAASRSSKASATRPESRSRPRVSWVRSFEPMEKPSKYSRNCSARMALLGISHIMISRRPFFPRSSPCAASDCVTPRASVSVRTKGIISSTLVSPIASRTYLRARHSSAKHSTKLGAT